ncbi:sigma-54-dependent Fis family transcriptional regulator [Pseudohongiella nitratireducens]|uniref:Sigma-54-dependent Fis family transcriptional regulator n=1 Tax=Pseudohongiella nitratireducens TaxID=1768907 RepID=A0A917GJM3_9GAMM|nr:sigma-54 dependent transcriptional regulator [Pseudohongiella nitratireducens]GGG48422.1 sigma-54-dependent Fis family transcriptional regulator [Pseudohongiella nitratireducens]
MSETTVLVAEDNPELREALVDTLELGGYQVIATESAEAALDKLQSAQVDLLLSDINMGKMDGHELLGQVRSLHPWLPVILITAFGNVGSSVRAMRDGAADYLLKPFKPEDLLASVSRYARCRASDSSEPVAVERESQQLLMLARKVAMSDATVLISGESGTGKEVLAQYIHRHSNRQGKPFVAINCAAIPENMLEATLFGHEKGAFTGAYNSSPGKFEQANGGTLLLDEVSEMDIGLQAKILRVLQEREVERLGGRKTMSLDVRVIATTNRDLKEAVRQGQFREDLYYRLSVFPLAWKSLRERPADIVPLAERLLSRHCERMEETANLDDSARNALRQYPWPGNVRELENVLQRALIIQEGGVINASALSLTTFENSIGATASLPEYEQDSEPSSSVISDADLGNDLKKREYEIILSTLRKQGGKRKETAEALGVSARTLRYKLARMRDMGINIDSLASA